MGSKKLKKTYIHNILLNNVLLNIYYYNIMYDL